MDDSDGIVGCISGIVIIGIFILSMFLLYFQAYHDKEKEVESFRSLCVQHGYLQQEIVGRKICCKTNDKKYLDSCISNY